jgi:predicted permease
VLRSLPAQGRPFLEEEERPGAPKVAILSHDLWLNRFGGAPVLNTTIRLDGEPYTIVGVMPDGFMPPDPGPEIFAPLPVPENASRTSYYLDLVARLAPGVTVDAANTEIGAVAERLAAEYPDQNQGVGARVVPLWDDMFGREFRDGSAIVSVAVLLLLLIASANVANLLLARAADRGREIAVRTALGAGRGRIVGQLLTESLVLAAGGAVIGLPLGWAGIQGLRTMFPIWMPRIDEIAMDWRIVVFGVAVTLVAGVLAGLAPALQASRHDLRESLQEGGRGAPMGRRTGRLRNAFIISEIAFALVLLVGAGLLVKGFVRLKGAHPGIETASVLTFRLTPPVTKYPAAADLRAITREVVDRLAALPGVTAAGVTSLLPFSGNTSTSYQLEGEDAREGEAYSAPYRSVTPGYFDALGIPLRRGRLLATADDSGTAAVVVVNESFARRHWPQGDALGRRLVLGSGPREIVGIVEDARESSIGDAPNPARVYLSASQSPFRSIGVALRASGDPMSIASDARAAVRQLDPDQPIFDVLSLDQRIALDLQADGIMSRIMLVLAGVALLLALVGVYGVMAYSVGQRRQEIGVRMALGAEQRDVVRLVVRHGARIAGIGCSIGLVLALGASRGLSVFLYGVNAFDPTTFAGVVAALAAAALLASYLPARTAARVNPVVALRGD